MTVGAERLERTRPEGFLIATMLLYVVAVQTAFACVYPAAHIAGEVDSDQHRPAQLLPPCGLVPSVSTLACRRESGCAVAH